MITTYSSSLLSLMTRGEFEQKGSGGFVHLGQCPSIGCSFDPLVLADPYGNGINKDNPGASRFSGISPWEAMRTASDKDMETVEGRCPLGTST